MPVFSVIAYIQEELPPDYQKWLAACEKLPPFHLLSLGPLSEKEYLSALQKLFSNKLEETPSLVEPFYRSTLGNPSLLRKLLQKLIDLKRIHYHEGAWQTELEGTLAVVKSFNLHQDFQPLAHWEAQERMILQRGAVFHRAFTLQALQGVSQIDPAIEGVSDVDLLKLLDFAVKTGVLYVSSGKFYAFRDNQVRHALLEQLPQKLRQEIHQTIARYLEEYILPEKMDAIYDIAFHWEKSGDRLRAMQYNLKAAQCTDDGTFRNLKSEIYYNLALKWLKQIPLDAVEPELQFDVRYNVLQHYLAKNSPEEKHWQEALALETWIGNNKIKRIQWLCLKALLSFVRNRKDLLFQYGQEALDLQTELEEEVHLVGIYNLMGRASSDKSYEERIALLKHGIALAQRYEHYAEIPTSLMVLMILMGYQGQFLEAEQLIEESCQKLEKIFPKEILATPMWIGLETERGNFAKAFELKKNLHLDHPLIAPQLEIFLQIRMALAQGMIGQFKESLPVFERWLESRNNLFFFHSLVGRIQLALRMGEWETALFYIDQAENSPLSDPYMLAQIALYEGFAYMRLESLDAAERSLEKAKHLAAPLESVLLNGHLEFAQAKLGWLQTKEAQFIKNVHHILETMMEHHITGYYEMYREDLQQWSLMDSISFSQFSSWGFANFEIAQLMEVNRKITATLELESLFETILEGAMTIVGAQQGYLFICDDSYDRTNPRLLPALRLTRSAKGKLIPVNHYIFSKSVVRAVMETQEAIITRDARHEKRWSVQESIAAHKLRSILAIPMKRQGKITGILYLEHHHASSVFSFKDKEIVEMFATQADIALNNAQAYEREQASRQQTEITLKTFERFVPRQFTDRFAEGNIENLTTGLSQQTRLSILFCDIRNFTTLSEAMSHREIFKFLNAFLLLMETPIHKNGGFIDKFIGDAIMALFEQSPQAAILAGLEMFSALQDYNKKHGGPGKRPLKMGVGINTGDVVLGVIGSHERTDTTVIGDTVNIAARLEELTKSYGASFLISGETQAHTQAMEGVLVRLIDEVQIKGKMESTQIYEIYNHDAEPLRAKKQAHHVLFQEAFHTYQQGQWLQCKKLFEAYLQQFPEDSVAVRLLERVEFFIKMPPQNWQGIYQFKS